jgi:hypothetical protein
VTGGKIAALIVGILLVVPGAGLLFLGIHMQSAVDPVGRDYGWMFIAIAFAILLPAALLFWGAFRRRASGFPLPRE